MRAQIIRSSQRRRGCLKKTEWDISLCKLNMKENSIFQELIILLIHARGEELKSTSTNITSREKHQVKLKKDDMLYIYSD